MKNKNNQICGCILILDVNMYSRCKFVTWKDWLIVSLRESPKYKLPVELRLSGLKKNLFRKAESLPMRFKSTNTRQVAAYE
jgi:hypothetical protein